MSATWERKEHARLEKLELIKEQVESGSLVIRRMTPVEREANPPRPRSEKRMGWKP